MCFMGFMVHIPKLDQNERVRFKVADCVVVPSRYEPFGLTVCEAWSAGKVVVVAWHFWHFGTLALGNHLACQEMEMEEKTFLRCFDLKRF